MVNFLLAAVSYEFVSNTTPPRQENLLKVGAGDTVRTRFPYNATDGAKQHN